MSIMEDYLGVGSSETIFTKEYLVETIAQSNEHMKNLYVRMDELKEENERLRIALKQVMYWPLDENRERKKYKPTRSVNSIIKEALREK